MKILCYTVCMNIVQSKMSDNINEDRIVTRERELENFCAKRIGKLCLVRDAVWLYGDADAGAFGAGQAHSSYLPTAENRLLILFPDTPFILLDVAQGELRLGGIEAQDAHGKREIRPCYKILIGDTIGFISNKTEFQEYHYAVSSRREKL